MVLDLNEEQAEAVGRDAPLVAVKAKPGSGKTRVVVAKAMRLLDEGREPWVLTFTNRAGQEIRNRIAESTGETLRKCGTFHSVFWDPCDKICTEEESKEQYWKEEGLVTYDMILQKVLDRPLKEVPQDVIVDECQDNDEYQWGIVEKLLDAGTRVTLVGDLDQSIYGWRGATPEVALGYFHRAYEQYDSCYTLGTNYRCHKNIQEFAEAWLDQEDCVRPEQVQVVSDITSNPPDAVLCKTNREVDIVTEILRSSGVQVAVNVDRKTLEKFAAWLGLLAYPYSVSKFVAATGIEGAELNEIRRYSMRSEKNMLESHSHVSGIRYAFTGVPHTLTPDIIEYVYIQLCGGCPIACDQLITQFGSHPPGEAAARSCVSMLAPILEDGVNVMTLHGSKGLEFDRVAIASSDKTWRPDDALRRLLYVGITRARDSVLIFNRPFFSPLGIVGFGESA